MIFEHRPDLQLQISEILVGLIKKSKNTHKLELYHKSKGVVEFYPVKWGTVPAELKKSKWKMDDMPLLFQFQNAADQLKLRLHIWAPEYPEPVLQTIHQFVLDNPKVFRRATKKLGARQTQLYTKQFLNPKDYEDADLDTLSEKIEVEWQKFLDKDLPAILKKLDQIDWTGFKTN